MKYYVIAAFVLVAGAAAMYFSQSNEDAEAAAHEQWRQNHVEAETRVRPEYFAEMKMDANVEMRAPASEKDPSKKKSK